MKKTLKSLFETGVLHLLVLCLIFALALVGSGCSVTKVNYEKDEKGPLQTACRGSFFALKHPANGNKLPR